MRASVTVGPLPAGGKAKFAAYFGDVRAYVYAVDAEAGKELWRLKADDHPVARITGSPVLHQNRLYVPVSSVEEAVGRSDKSVGQSGLAQRQLHYELPPAGRGQLSQARNSGKINSAAAAR